MFAKALFIDFKPGSIEKKYFGRIIALFKSTKFIDRNDSNLANELKDTEAIFCQISTRIDKSLMNSAPKLKYVGVCSTAFDAIDAAYAKAKNIAVCNLGGYSTEAVAEFFFAALFEQVRALEKGKIQARHQDYSFSNFMGIDLKGKTLGVIGAGKIGSRVAEIGLGIGMKVIYFSRKNKSAIEKLGASKKVLNEVLKHSDFISLNLLLNKKTKNIISKEKVNLLKKGCVFINLAPPPLIDQEAMMIKAGKGDIVFIFDHSDDIDKALAKRFLKTKNCIVYPPLAFRTDGANTTRWETFIGNIEQFAKGTPQNKVN